MFVRLDTMSFKYLTLSLLLLLFASLSAWSQTVVCPGGVLHNQAEVDALAGCTHIDGDLFIGEYDVANDITNLDSLFSLFDRFCCSLFRF